MGRLTCLKPRVAPARPARDLPNGTPERENVGRAWRRIRHRVLTRDCGLCRACFAADRLRAATDVDHIVPVWEGGTDDESNLQSLCDDCHKRKTAAEAAWRAARGAR